MDGLAIAASITEAKEAILGAVIRTIYQPEFATFVLHLFAGRNLRLLLSPGKATIHLTGLDLAYPQSPSPFVMLLRKHLRGGRIVDIEQSGWDRVVTLTVERRQDEEKRTFRLVVELLRVRGNLILLRSDRVVAALRSHQRVVPGEVYQPLPSQDKIDPAKITRELLEEALDQEEPIRALVHRVDGIGRRTAEALIARTRADGASADEIMEGLSLLLERVKDPRAEVDLATNWAAFFPLTPPGERSNRSNRVCLRAGMEMEERFLLYRVNPPRNYLTVDQAVEDTTPVFSNPAYPPPRFVYLTMMCA